MIDLNNEDFDALDEEVREYFERRLAKTGALKEQRRINREQTDKERIDNLWMTESSNINALSASIDIYLILTDVTNFEKYMSDKVGNDFKVFYITKEEFDKSGIEYADKEGLIYQTFSVSWDVFGIPSIENLILRKNIDHIYGFLATEDESIYRSHLTESTYI